MKTRALIFFLLIVSTLTVAQQVNPAYQINWPMITGSGAPTASCASPNYGQPYRDIAAHQSYVCDTTGWVLIVSGSGTVLAGTPYALSGYDSAGDPQVGPTNVTVDSPAGNFTVHQPIAATSGANQDSPTMGLSGNYFYGGSSAPDQWYWQDIIASTGSAPATTYTLNHSGSAGAATVSIPFPMTVPNVTITGAPSGSYAKADGTGYGTPSTLPSGTPNQVVATNPSGSTSTQAYLRGLVAADLPSGTLIVPGVTVTGSGSSQVVTFPGNVAVTSTLRAGNISGVHYVDGVNAWSSATTITAAYVDACTNGGSIVITQAYAGAETIPYSCAFAGVSLPVQPYPSVTDFRQTQAAYGGLNVLPFGMDGTGSGLDTTANYLGAVAASQSVGDYVPNIGNMATLHFPTGAYTVHEASTAGLAIMGDGLIGSARIYYGGAGGANSYMVNDSNTLAYGGLKGLGLFGTNATYHTSITTMAQNMLNLPQLDAAATLSDFQCASFYGNCITIGNTGPNNGGPRGTQVGNIINGWISHFRADGIGGYTISYSGSNTASGSPFDMYDFTDATGMGATFAAYGIANGYFQGTGSTLTSNHNGSLYIYHGGGVTFHVHEARIEENLNTNNIGNADQGMIFSADDSSAGKPNLLMDNIELAGVGGTGAHPIVSTAKGLAPLTLSAGNSAAGISGIYKNRLTQQEYGDQTKAAKYYSIGFNPVQFQGSCWEDWCFDVTPKASLSLNNSPRNIGDWFMVRNTDFVPGLGGPINVVTSPGRSTLASATAITSTGTLAINSTFNQSSLLTVTSSGASGGSISGVGDCTMSSFNNGLVGATATITFTISGSYTGSSVVVNTQGFGATSAPTTATLTSGSATCSGTVTFTSTLTTPTSYPLGSINTASGGTLSVTSGQTCQLMVAPTLSNGNYAVATVTFAGTNTWTGAIFNLINAGMGFSSAPVSGTLSSGTGTCFGTATLTTAIASSSYANLTGFVPNYSTSHYGVHIGDTISILASDATGTVQSPATVVCTDNMGSGAWCSGLGIQGVVVSPAPPCIAASTCAATGAVIVQMPKSTTSNFALEANRVSTLPAAGSACPYVNDIEWLTPPVTGQPMNATCGPGGWVLGPQFGATISSGGNGALGVSYAGGDLICAMAGDTSIGSTTITGGTSTTLSMASVPGFMRVIGTVVGVTGASPAGLNTSGTAFYTVTAWTATTLTFASLPATWTSGGTVFLGCQNTSNATSTVGYFANNTYNITALTAGNTFTQRYQMAYWSSTTAPSITFYHKLGTNAVISGEGTGVPQGGTSANGAVVVWTDTAISSTQVIPTLVSASFSTVVAGHVSAGPITVPSSGALQMGIVYTATGLASITSYTSGATVTGSIGQTCTLGSFNSSLSGAAVTATLTASNTLAGATFVVTNTGYGATAAPTTATVSSGTATCSGTATLVSVLGPAQGNAVLVQTLTTTP